VDIPKYRIALIVGAGSGLSASLARLFAHQAFASRWPHGKPKSSVRSAPRPARAPLPATPPTLMTSSGCSAWSNASSACPTW
jgi:hypothetical protein